MSVRISGLVFSNVLGVLGMRGDGVRQYLEISYGKLSLFPGSVCKLWGRLPFPMRLVMYLQMFCLGHDPVV